MIVLQANSEQEAVDMAMYTKLVLRRVLESKEGQLLAMIASAPGTEPILGAFFEVIANSFREGILVHITAKEISEQLVKGVNNAIEQALLAQLDDDNIIMH